MKLSALPLSAYQHSAVTVSLHIPAKMSAFNSRMWQNVLACYYYTRSKDQE